MQGHRSIFGPFPETIDLNQGSISNNAPMDITAVQDDTQNPLESRLLNYTLASSSGNVDLNTSVNLDTRGFSGWESGESSSAANLQDRVYSDDSKIGITWSSSLSAYDAADSRRSGPSNIPIREAGTSFYDGNHISGVPPFGASGNVGASSVNPSYFTDNNEDSGSSLGNWSLSGKSKSVEGTSGQSYLGGSSSSNPQPDNFLQQTFPPHYNASNSSSISAFYNPPPISSHLDLQNPSFGNTTRGISSEIFPPLSITGIAERSTRNSSGRASFGPQELDMFDAAASGSNSRHPSFGSTPHSSRPVSIAESSNLGHQPSVSISSSSRSRVPGFSRGMLPPPWNGSPSSMMLPGERGAPSRNGDNFRNSQTSTDRENPAFVSSPEMRSMVQEPSNWDLASARTSSSRNYNSGSQVGAVNGSRASTMGWIPHQNLSTHNQQRLPDRNPWTLFPAEPEYEGPRGRLSPLPLSPSSSEIGMVSSGRTSRSEHQPLPRSGALMEIPGDDANIWRALSTDAEGRRRLIRQVLNAMWRTQSIRSQDYMMFDPFVEEFAEMHDRHRDMRLDVDNMSYEELLALEERIGNVSTGLSEEIIMRSMKQRRHSFFDVGSSSTMEPCCVCQEEYVAGDDIGILDCGHEFHTNCIKQWLTLKNLCPICKTTAFGT